MNQEKVLIVEDEENERSGLAELVALWGFKCETACDGVEALEKIESWSPTIVVTDLMMPRMDGRELLRRIAELPQECKVIVMTAHGSVDSAVEAMKIGAYDYIQKGGDPTRLRTILKHAVSQRDAEVELEVTRRTLRDKGVMGPMVGSSRKMQEIFHLVEMVAPSTASVLITGRVPPDPGQKICRQAVGVCIPRLADEVEVDYHAAGISTVLALRHRRSRS